MADGSIRIGTKIDFSGVKKDIKALEKELATIQKETDKLNEKEKKVLDKYKEDRDFDAQFPAEMSHREMIDEEASKKLDPIIKDRETLNEKAREYTALLEQAKGKLQEQQLIEQANNELSRATKAEGVLSKIQTQEQYNSLLEQTKAQMATIEALAERIAVKHGLSKEQILSTNTEYAKLSDTLTILSGKQDEFKHKSKDSFNEGKKGVQAFDRSIKSAIKKVARMGIGLLGARSAFMALRKAASTYMDANEDLKNQVQGLWDVLAVAIGPVVEKLVSWLTIAISYVNAFVKALWGIDLVAKANALALKKQAKATTAAAKASKQLAGFDEMNKLSDTSASGGGADSASVGTFQAVPVDTGAVDDFIEKLRIILPIVSAIATGIAAWKVASFFGATLKGSASWAMIIAGAVLVIWSYCDAIVNGLDWGNLALVISGLALVVGGLFLQFGKLAGSIGLLVSGISLLVLGVVDFIKNGPTVQNTILIIGGAIATAVALATMGIGPLIAAIIGAVAAVVAFTAAILLEEPAIMSTKEAQEALTEAKNRAAEAENSYINAVDAAESAMKRLKDAEEAAGVTGAELYKQVQDGTLDYANMTDAQKEVYKAYLDNEQKQKDLEASTKAFNEAKKAETIASYENQLALAKESGNYDDFKKSVVAAFEAGELSADEARELIGKSMSEMSDDSQKTFMEDLPGDIKKGLDPSQYETTRKKMGDWFKKVGKGFIENVWQPVKDFWNKHIAPIFTKKWWSDKFDAIKQGAKSALNGAIGIVENAINFIIKKLNTLSWDIPDWVPLIGGEKFGFNFKLVSIPRLATGGIVNRPGRGVPAIIGEAGAEAVLPLENNTEWMDMLAEKIGGNVTIPIYLGGKKIAEYVVDLQKKQAFARNGA